MVIQNQNNTTYDLLNDIDKNKKDFIMRIKKSFGDTCKMIDF